MASEMLLAGLAGGMQGLEEGLEKLRERLRLATEKKEKRRLMKEYADALGDAGLSKTEVRVEVAAAMLGKPLGETLGQFGERRKTKAGIRKTDAETKAKKQESIFNLLKEAHFRKYAGTEVETGIELDRARSRQAGAATTASERAGVASDALTGLRGVQTRKTEAELKQMLRDQEIDTSKWPSDWKTFRSVRKEIMSEVREEIESLREEFGSGHKRHIARLESAQSRELTEEDYTVPEDLRTFPGEPDWPNIRRDLTNQILQDNFGSGATFELMRANISRLEPEKAGVEPTTSGSKVKDDYLKTHGLEAQGPPVREAGGEPQRIGEKTEEDIANDIRRSGEPPDTFDIDGIAQAYGLDANKIRQLLGANY